MLSAAYLIQKGCKTPACMQAPTTNEAGHLRCRAAIDGDKRGSPTKGGDSCCGGQRTSDAQGALVDGGCAFLALQRPRSGGVSSESRRTRVPQKYTLAQANEGLHLQSGIAHTSLLSGAAPEPRLEHDDRGAGHAHPGSAADGGLHAEPGQRGSLLLVLLLLRLLVFSASLGGAVALLLRVAAGALITLFVGGHRGGNGRGGSPQCGQNEAASQTL